MGYDMVSGKNISKALRWLYDVLSIKMEDELLGQTKNIPAKDKISSFW